MRGMFFVLMLVGLPIASALLDVEPVRAEEPTIEAIEAGCHVLGEKPISNDIAQADGASASMVIISASNPLLSRFKV